jgi:hypothetical protein
LNLKHRFGQVEADHHNPSIVPSSPHFTAKLPFEWAQSTTSIADIVSPSWHFMLEMPTLSKLFNCC